MQTHTVSKHARPKKQIGRIENHKKMGKTALVNPNYMISERIFVIQ